MPNLGELIFTLPVVTRQEIRKLEKVCLKLNKTELACAFNECCLRENILPKYSQIKLHDKAANTEELTNDFRRKLVERQLEESKTKVLELKEENVKHLKAECALRTDNQTLKLLHYIQEIRAQNFNKSELEDWS